MGRRNQNRAPKRRVTAADLPSVETADFDDPESHALWALNGLPLMKGAPLAFPQFFGRQISRRLWDAGFRYHPELRTIKYRAPHAGMGVGMLSSAGEWVPIEEPDEDRAADVREAVAGLPVEQRSQIAAALGLDGAAPDDDGLVPYRSADGTERMVTRAQAQAWASAKKARRKAQE